MSRSLEQTFLQRRYKSDQETHEKVLSIANHQENAQWDPALFPLEWLLYKKKPYSNVHCSTVYNS